MNVNRPAEAAKSRVDTIAYLQTLENSGKNKKRGREAKGKFKLILSGSFFLHSISVLAGQRLRRHF